MISYGDAIDWCIRHEAVFRFVERKKRTDFILMNESVPGQKALELAITVEGKTVAVHAPLDSSQDPTRAIAGALIACVMHFITNRSQVRAAVNG